MGSIWFLVLILMVSASSRKHNKGAWTEQPIGLSVFFLTPSRLSVKSYQLGLQREQIQVWSNWRRRKHWWHLKRPWCWEGLKAGGEGDDRGWDGWVASPTPWTRIWVNSGSWWWTGRPGVLQFLGSQRVRHDWATELNELMA